MQLTENSDEISIRHIPVGKWIIGGALIFIFSVFSIWFIFSAIFSSSNSFEAGTESLIKILPLLIFGASIILITVFGISLHSMIFAPLTTVTISRKTESIDILYQRFYGKNAKRYYFHQIEKFKSYKGAVNFSSRYFLALILANHKQIKLSIPIGKDKQHTIKLIKRLNKFIKPKGLQKSVVNK